MGLADDLRKSVLQAAIQGKLVPQDPHDEPASVLLERIEAEKKRLIEDKKLNKEKPLAPITEEVPFDIPGNWEWTSIGTCCINISYGTSQKSSPTGKIPVLRMGNIQSGKINYSDLVYSNDDMDIYKYSLEYNDLLFNRTNSKQLVGKTAIYKAEKAAIYAGYLIRITPLFINSDYLNYVMQSSYYKAYCWSVKSDGVDQSNINAEKLKAFCFPLPPLNEQQRIVIKVEELMEKVDEFESIEKELESIKKSFPEDLKKSLLQAAIHGKLTEKLPSDGSAQDLIKEIEQETNTQIKTNYEEDFLIEIPSTWVYVKLGEVLSIARGGSPRPIKDFLTDSPDGVNWIKIGDSDKGGKYLNATNEKIKPEGMLKSRFVKKGDFLLSNSMSFGRPYILNIDGCIHDGWLVLSKVEQCFDKDYLYYLLSSMFVYYQFCGKVSGAVVNNLNSDKVRETIVPLPPLAEQHRIVEKLDKLLPCCEGLI